MSRATAVYLGIIVAMTFVTTASGSAMGSEGLNYPNPYQGNPASIEQGRKLYFKMGCNVCHGARGEGKATTPANNDDRWKFGSDNATLRRLISGQLSSSTMPSYGDSLTADQIDKILAFVRSFYIGDPKLIDW